MSALRYIAEATRGQLQYISIRFPETISEDGKIVDVDLDEDDIQPMSFNCITDFEAVEKEDEDEAGN